MDEHRKLQVALLQRSLTLIHETPMSLISPSAVQCSRMPVPHVNCFPHTVSLPKEESRQMAFDRHNRTCPAASHGLALYTITIRHRVYRVLTILIKY